MINAEKDFETLHERLEKERAMSKVVFKRPVGRPKKELEAMLLKPRVEPMKKQPKRSEVLILIGLLLLYGLPYLLL